MSEVVSIVLGGFWPFVGAILLIGAIFSGIARVILAIRGIKR